MEPYIPEMFFPEVKKEDIEEDALSPTMFPDCTLGPPNEKDDDLILDDMKEEDDIKIEEEDVPPADPLMMLSQQGPSSEDSTRTKGENNTRKFLAGNRKAVVDVNMAREMTSNSGDMTYGSDNVEVGHGSKCDHLFVGATAEPPPTFKTSPESTTQPTKRQKVMPIAKQDHITNKPWILKIIQKDPSKSQYEDTPMIFEVTVDHSKNQDSNKTITLTPYKVISVPTKSDGGASSVVPSSGPEVQKENKQKEVQKDNKQKEVQKENKQKEVQNDNKQKEVQKKNKQKEVQKDNKQNEVPIDNKQKEVQKDNKQKEVQKENKQKEVQKDDEELKATCSLIQHYERKLDRTIKEHDMKMKLLELELQYRKAQLNKYTKLKEQAESSVKDFSKWKTSIKLFCDSMKK